MKRTVFVGVLLALGCMREAPPPSAPCPVVSPTWDEAAAQEARATIERDMQSLGNLDIEALRHGMASEGFATTFDIDMMGKPIAFTSGEEAIQFLGGMFAELKKAGATLQFTPTSPIECRAMSGLAYCAFSAEVRATMGGKVETAAQRTTAVMRKEADGWKWTHWHASLATVPAAPPPAVPPPPPAPWPTSFFSAADLKWEAPEGAPPGLKFATASGDPTKSAFSGMVEFPKKLSIPRHYHSANLWGYVVKGDITIKLADGRVLGGKPGATIMLPAKVIHTTETTAGASMFQYADGPDDIVFVDDQGNPTAPPGPPPPAKK